MGPSLGDPDPAGFSAFLALLHVRIAADAEGGFRGGRSCGHGASRPHFPAELGPLERIQAPAHGFPFVAVVNVRRGLTLVEPRRWGLLLFSPPATREHKEHAGAEEGNEKLGHASNVRRFPGVSKYSQQNHPLSFARDAPTMNPPQKRGRTGFDCWFET